MKHYLTFLTLSFLSTTTFVEAGRHSYFEHLSNANTKTRVLTAKANKLVSNIEGTQNEDLRKAYTEQQEIVSHLLEDPINEEYVAEYKNKKGRIASVKTTVLESSNPEEYRKKFDLIELAKKGIIETNDSEVKILNTAWLNLLNLKKEAASPQTKRTAISRYLKVEKPLNQILQRLELTIPEFLKEADEIRKTTLLRDVGHFLQILPYDHPEYDAVRKATSHLEIISNANSESTDIVRCVFEYRNLKEKLSPLLEDYSVTKKKAISFTPSLLGGDHPEFEEMIKQWEDDGTSLEYELRIFRKFAFSLTKKYVEFKEAQTLPKIKEDLPAAAEDTNEQLTGTMPAPVQSEEVPGGEEAPRENIAKSVFKFNFPFGNLSGVYSSKSFNFVPDPSQKVKKHGPKNVTQTGQAGHVTIEGDGYVFFYQIPPAQMKERHGQQFKFEVEMKTTTPGAYIQYWGFKDARSEKLKSASHNGDGNWQTLSLDFTIDDKDTQYFIYPAIMPAVPSSHEAPVVEVKNARVTQL